MKVHTLTLKNFRGFTDVTLDLDRPLTVLFGPNGSGKSSVLDALVLVVSKVLQAEFDDAGVATVAPTNEDIALGARSMGVGALMSNGALRNFVGVQHALSRHALDESAQYVPVLFGGAPFLALYYGATRSVASGTSAFEVDEATRRNAPPLLASLRDALVVGSLKFRSLFAWFKEREDAENELKVSRGDLSLEDPLLGAVRRAVAGMLPGFSGLRVQRDPLHMVIRKGATLLAVDQLSDGEKLLLALAADLARRLAITHATGDPLLGEALVLIDEVELHLHPAWQRHVLGRLRTTFPRCQFVVTTHSPQVLSEVPNDAVVLVRDFQFSRPGAPTAGRDTNAILSEVMDTPERPEAERDAIRGVSSLLDEGRYSEARTKLDELARAVTERDREVVGLRTMLHFLEGDDASDPQGA
jgi:predicted ATP-binding protein involved in virulence